MNTRVFLSIIISVWTAIVAASLFWSLYTIKESNFLLVSKIGETFFKEIETTRLWNAQHGGVYVPVTEQTQPNPYLTDEDRDILTTDGRKLTKINPAFMTRQIASLAKTANDIQYHITSLKPIRPANKADDWEHKALLQFEKGLPSITEFIATKQVYRYMAPLPVKEACLKCHEQQGYKLGEVRGGISVTIPSAPYIESKYESQYAAGLIHALFWFVGTIGLTLFVKYRNSRLELLNKKNIWLNREIGERKKLSEKLLEAKNEAESANKAKSRFLANMSHEMRTPFNAILGYTELMILSDSVSEEHKEHLELIMRSGENLLQLINQVLDLSKIESGKVDITLKPFHLPQLLSDVVEIFKLNAKEKSIDLLYNHSPLLPEALLGDELKLRQVLINLLGNSVKFTAQGSVSMNVWLDQKQADISDDAFMVRFEVEDTGPGIETSELGQLFQSFQQTSSGKSIQQGTGLGLAVSHKLVELMGGELTVTSEPSVKTVFSFSLPFVKCNTPFESENKPSQKVVGLVAGQPDFKILVVDDHKANRMLMRKILEPIGFKIKEAENGKKAIEVWEKWSPDLIWLDMKMPVMDGFETAKKMKSTEKGQKTIVIAFTASVFEDSEKVIADTNCDDFLRKPFHQHEVFSMIEKHLNLQYVYK